MPGRRSWMGRPRRPWAFRCHGNRREQVRRDGSAVGGLHAGAGREAVGPQSGARKAGRSYEACWTSRPPLGPMKASRIGVPMRSMCDRDEDERYALGLEASRFPWSRRGIAGKFHAPSTDRWIRMRHLAGRRIRPIAARHTLVAVSGRGVGARRWTHDDDGNISAGGASHEPVQDIRGGTGCRARATRRERHVRTRPVHGRHGPSGWGKSTLMHCRPALPTTW
jgi:hypothetical protein